MYRGSRKHILDWVETPRFLPELLELALPLDCRVTSGSLWQPTSYRCPSEARLESFGPRILPNHEVWKAIRSWWLKHEGGANAPNWDIALSCDVEGQPGLILVEAKANVPELSRAGKPREKNPSTKSQENHEHISTAIAEARADLQSALPGLRIDRDDHYQLSNRLAFSWKLASLGVPTVLIYLGFVGDSGIRDVGLPFENDDHWQASFAQYLKGVCPSPLLGSRMNTGNAAFWVLAKSRRILNVSPNVERCD
jgi:hypothetical protein